jgi:hypothetical protein
LRLGSDGGEQRRNVGLKVRPCVAAQFSVWLLFDVVTSFFIFFYFRGFCLVRVSQTSSSGQLVKDFTFVQGVWSILGHIQARFVCFFYAAFDWFNYYIRFALFSPGMFLTESQPTMV